MTSDELRQRFPRSHAYSLDWIREGGMGSHPLWLAEWLSQSLDLRPGMRVLDLGCGKAKSSIFLAREFGVEVWAADLWVSPSENFERIRDAGLDTTKLWEGSPNPISQLNSLDVRNHQSASETPPTFVSRVIPVRGDAHKLPFAADYFDVITAHDCYSYFGTDDLYLNYLAQFVKPGGQIGIAGAGLAQELPAPVPEHLRPIWSHDFFCLHSADWWRHHWARTGIVTVEQADSMPNAAEIWTHWQHTNSPDNVAEINVVEEDAGRYLTYIRMVGRRNEGVEFQPYCWPDGSFSLPHSYESKPLVQSGS